MDDDPTTGLPPDSRPSDPSGDSRPPDPPGGSPSPADEDRSRPRAARAVSSDQRRERVRADRERRAEARRAGNRSSGEAGRFGDAEGLDGTVRSGDTGDTGHPGDTGRSEGAGRSGASRRRGKELEKAILDAAWEELTVSGYAGMTFEAVAARAGTSRTVLYRRWPTLRDLVEAAIRHERAAVRIEVPDTGHLREDLIGLLVEASRRRGHMAAVFSVQMAGYFGETGLSPADLRRTMLAGTPDAFTQVLQRAAERGDVDLESLTPRVRSLPADLLRGEVLLAHGPLPQQAAEQIVDEIVLPLWLGTARGVREPAESESDAGDG